MNVAKRDYYEVLGVGRDVDDSALKGAYRKLAMQFHPDRNPNNPAAEEKFKEAAEAYSILSDSTKRAAYDRFGHAAVSGAGSDGGGSNGFPDIEDLFSSFGLGDLFGQAGGRRGAGGAGAGAGARSRTQRGPLS